MMMKTAILNNNYIPQNDCITVFVIK